MRRWLVVVGLLLGLLAMPLAAQDQMELPPEIQQKLDGLHPQSGSISLPAADATLDLGDAYIFYGPEDAKTILVDLWGNPPTVVSDTLGLVMPAGSTPFSDTWGAVVTYENTGWVSDDDAGDADYDELIEQMREASIANNKERVAQGYPELTVVGWAQSPHYDPATHSVIWARELDTADSDVHPLNYDLRTLGRRGVLSINMLSSMPELPEIQLAARDFASHAAFNRGARFEDYDSSTDEAAGYGIAGLIAGGAGLAVAKKVGLLAILIKFIKPILIGLVVFFGAIWVRLKRMLGMGETQDETNLEEHYSSPEDAELAELSQFEEAAERDDPPTG